MPSQAKGLGPSHWSRVGARVLDPHIDFWGEKRLPNVDNLFGGYGFAHLGKRKPCENRKVFYAHFSDYFVGVSLMIPMEFSGRVRVNCFLMVP